MHWIVGDVHGCAVTAERLLATIGYEPGRDVLWCTGDLVNRGPRSVEALRLWRDAGGRTVLGNHDIYALRLRGGTVPRRPDRLDALLTVPDGDAILLYLREQPLFARLPGAAGAPETWLVHAGLDPRWEDPPAVLLDEGPVPHDEAWLSRPDAVYATRVRCCTPHGPRSRHTGPPEECPAPYRPWDTFYRGRAVVVHGHWGRRGHYRNGRVIGLDSACVYGGALTAWSLEEDRIVQVPYADG